jgi:hypothetical protein
MPTVSPLQSNFNGGELSPSLFGRLDADRYKQSLAKCLNYITLIQGPLDRRPGTYFVKEVKDSTKFTRLVRFEFSITQAYILEFGDLYIRFYANYGQVLNGMAPLEVVTPYTTANLPFLNFTQSADVLYIVGLNFPPMKLERHDATDWRLVQLQNLDGPYLPTNTTKFSLRALANTGTGVTVRSTNTYAITNMVASPSGEIRATITAHQLVTGQKIVITGVTGTTEANNSGASNWSVRVVDLNTIDLQGSVFVHPYIAGGTATPAIFISLDVGRLIRMKVNTTWGWAKIVSFVNQHEVTVDIYSAFDGGTDTFAWRLGVWSAVNGYPSCVTFHEDRLSFSGVGQYPQRIDCSQSSDYENFAPTELDGSVQDNNALSFSLNSNDVNANKWLMSDEKGMIAGSSGGEWIVRPSINQEAMTPTNISAKKTTAWGSQGGIAAFLVGKATLFVQKGGKKIRELLFYFDIDGYRSTDLTELSEHITGHGVTDLTYQKAPQSILWAVRDDGYLLGMTYERDTQNLKVGWHKHVLGGTSDAAGTNAVVESISVIPSPTGIRSDLWMVVKRRVNGSTKRYVEYMSKFFEDTDLQEEAHFVDCGALYDLPITITSATAANPVVLGAPGHGFSNGDKIVIRGIAGMTELNYNRYVVANAALNTFELNDSSGNTIDGTGFLPYVSGGTVRKLVTTISGLTHLEGETVDILADGAVLAQTVVTAGAITLPLPSATVHIGYGYNSDGQLLRLEAGSANGTALGKTRRTTRVSFLLHRSLGLKFGMNENELDTIIFRTDAVAPNHAPPLFTGIQQETITADYDFDNQLFFRQDQPLPSKILAIAIQMQEQDRA